MWKIHSRWGGVWIVPWGGRRLSVRREFHLPREQSKPRLLQEQGWKGGWDYCWESTECPVKDGSCIPQYRERWRAAHIWTIDQNVLREDKTGDHVQAIKRSGAADGSYADWLVRLAFYSSCPSVHFDWLTCFQSSTQEVASTYVSWVRCEMIQSLSFL